MIIKTKVSFNPVIGTEIAIIIEEESDLNIIVETMKKLKEEIYRI